MRTATADLIMLQLQRGTLDAGLLLAPVETELFDTFVMDDHEELILLLREDDPLSARPEITAADLKGRRLILPSRELIRRELSRSFALSENELQQNMLCDLSGNAALLVHSGAGPALIVRDDYSYLGIPGLTTRPLSPPVVLQSILTYKKPGMQSPTARAFIAFLQQKSAAGQSAADPGK